MGDKDNSDVHHAGYGGGSGKREDKVPVAASAASATAVKVPKKKGRKVKPKGACTVICATDPIEYSKAFEI
jgi:hypothetical protein